MIWDGAWDRKKLEGEVKSIIEGQDGICKNLSFFFIGEQASAPSIRPQGAASVYQFDVSLSTSGPVVWKRKKSANFVKFPEMVKGSEISVRSDVFEGSRKWDPKGLDPGLVAMWSMVCSLRVEVQICEAIPRS